jgi:hypothetical protein
MFASDLAKLLEKGSQPEFGAKSMLTQDLCDGCTQERIHTPYPRDLTTNAPLARHTVSSPILLIRKFHAKSNADAHSNTKFDGISYLFV